MRELLYKFDISDDEYNEILAMYPNLEEPEVEEVEMLIQVLENIGCDDIQIKHIIICNPYFIYRYSSDIQNLILVLEKYNFEMLFLLFEENPLILNLNDFQIENYIEEQVEIGRGLDEVIIELESNPQLFNII